MDFPRFLAQGAEWVMVSFIDLGDRDWLLPGRQKPRFTSKHSWTCPVVSGVVVLTLQQLQHHLEHLLKPGPCSGFSKLPGPALAFLIRIWGET